MAEMKKALLLLAATIAHAQFIPIGPGTRLIASGGPGWSVIQSVYSDNHGSGTGGSNCLTNTAVCTVNFLKPTTPGNQVVYFTAPCCNGSSTTLSSVSGDTTTDCTVCDGGQNGGVWVGVRYAASTTGNLNSTQCSLSQASLYISCGAIELHWNGTGTPQFDVGTVSVSPGCTGCTAPITLCATGGCAANSEAVIEVFNPFGTDTGMTGTGWVRSLDGSTCCSGISVGTLVNTTTGTTPTFNQTPSSQAVISAIALNTGCVTGCGGGGTTISVVNPGNGLTPAVCNGTTDDSGAFQAMEAFAESRATLANPYTLLLPPTPANCFLGGGNSSGDGSAGIVMRGNNVTLAGPLSASGGPNGQITFTGAGCIPGLNACGAVSFGQWSTTWRNGSPSYNINDTHYGDPSLTLAFSADWSAFTSGCVNPGCVGDLVTFFQEYPDGGPAGNACSPDFGNFCSGHCFDCDTIPMQTEAISAYNSGTGVITLAGPVYVGFTNNRYQAPGQGLCHLGVNSPAGSNCLAACAPTGTPPACTGNPQTSYQACLSDFNTYGNTDCTPGYPNQGNKVVAAINTNNHAAQNIGVKNIIFHSDNWPMIMSQDFNGRISNLLITSQNYCNLQTTNSETHLIIDKVIWQGGPFCQGRTSEGFQRESSMTWSNSTFGDSSFTWSGGFGSVEPPYNFAWIGNTMFLGVQSSGINADHCDMEFGAAGLNFSGNTISTFQPCTLPSNPPYAFMIADTINTGTVVNSGNNAAWYANHQVFDSNTFNCQPGPGACLNLLSSDSTVTNNTFNFTGAGGIAIGEGQGNQSNPIYSAQWNFSNNTFNNMVAGTTGIYVPGGYGTVNFHFDGNHFNGTGGTSIQMNNNDSGTTTGCSIHGNIVQAGITGPQITNHGSFCTFP